MQQKRWASLFRGYVVIELIGGDVSALINESQVAGITLWDISWQKNGHAICSLHVRQFRRFRKVARSTGVKFHILQKRGMPFMLFRLGRRRFFAFGFVLFLIVLIVMSNMIWDIDVEGNETIPDEEVLRLAREAGIYVGQFQFRLEDNDAIQHKLLLALSDASWIGVRMQGTRALITVVEKRRIDERERTDKDDGPYDLVAKRAATIVDLSGVETGRLLVDYNQTVQKGQKLVSGVYGNEESEKQIIAGARGVVIGETWYETTVSVPLEQTNKMYTGAKELTHYPFIGHYSLRVPLLENMPYERYETVENVKTLHFFRWKLPFGLIEAKHMEMKEVTVKRTKVEAEELALARAREDVLSRLGPYGKIRSTKVLQKGERDGKVKLKILFTVRENIAQPEPILFEKSEDDT